MQAFRKLIKLYLFDRPEGGSSTYIAADLIALEGRGWLSTVLTQMVAEGELTVVAGGWPDGPRRIYRLSASAWLWLLGEMPECRVRELKKLKLLPG